MIHEEKIKHPWHCDVSRGDEQCPYVTQNVNGYLNCVWKKDHPADLPHEAYYDQPNGPADKEWVLPATKGVVKAVSVTSEAIDRQKIIELLVGKCGMILTTPISEVTDVSIMNAQRISIEQLLEEVGKLAAEIQRMDTDLKAFYKECSRNNVRVYRDGDKLKLDRLSI